MQAAFSFKSLFKFFLIASILDHYFVFERIDFGLFKILKSSFLTLQNNCPAGGIKFLIFSSISFCRNTSRRLAIHPAEMTVRPLCPVGGLIFLTVSHRHYGFFLVGLLFLL